MTKLVVTRELVGNVVCSSYVTHQKVISYSWILTSRAYSPLKSTRSTTAFNRKKWLWNLSISLASDPTCSWILLWSQVFADGLVCHSARSQIGRKSLLKFSSYANFCLVRQVTWGGRAQVLGRSLIGRKVSQASRRSVASVSRRLGHGCDSGARVYADRLTNGVRGSLAHKSVVGGSQVILITWTIIHFFFTRMSVALQHWCKR